MNKESSNKKQNIIINVYNFAKDYAKDQLKKIVYTGITAFICWGAYTIQTSVNKITSLPKKYERMLEIREGDSVRAMAHLRSDSIHDVTNAMQIISLKHAIDSIGKSNKYKDSILSVIERDEYLDLAQIKQKLKIK